MFPSKKHVSHQNLVSAPVSSTYTTHDGPRVKVARHETIEQQAIDAALKQEVGAYSKPKLLRQKLNNHKQYVPVSAHIAKRLRHLAKWEANSLESSHKLMSTVDAVEAKAGKGAPGGPIFLAKINLDDVAAEAETQSKLQNAEMANAALLEKEAREAGDAKLEMAAHKHLKTHTLERKASQNLIRMVAAEKKILNSWGTIKSRAAVQEMGSQDSRPAGLIQEKAFRTKVTQHTVKSLNEMHKIAAEIATDEERNVHQTTKLKP